MTLISQKPLGCGDPWPQFSGKDHVDPHVDCVRRILTRLSQIPRNLTGKVICITMNPQNLKKGRCLASKIWVVAYKNDGLGEPMAYMLRDECMRVWIYRYIYLHTWSAKKNCLVDFMEQRHQNWWIEPKTGGTQNSQFLTIHFSCHARFTLAISREESRQRGSLPLQLQNTLSLG